MRLMLVLVLTLFPFIGHTADSISLSPNGTEQKTDPSIIEKPFGEESLIDQPGPYVNPYHPTSATNFEAFTVPLLPSPEVNDRSRLSRYLSDSGPSPAIYGHFGNPFFPPSINHRNATDHPYALDSPTNNFGRSWLTEKR